MRAAAAGLQQGPREYRLAHARNGCPSARDRGLGACRLSVAAYAARTRARAVQICSLSSASVLQSLGSTCRLNNATSRAAGLHTRRRHASTTKLCDTSRTRRALGRRRGTPRKLEASAAAAALPRRAALALTLTPAAAHAAQLTDQNAPVTRPEAGRALGEAILPPVLFGRATYRLRFRAGAYAFEQLLRFQNVSATVRMNVQRLRNGKLWVVAPVAPTGECFSLLLKDIGEVEHLVLPVTALEHKAFFGPFQRQFPSASCVAAPGQYGPFGTPVSPETSTPTISSRRRATTNEEGTSSRPGRRKSKPRRSTLISPGNAGPVSEAALLPQGFQNVVRDGRGVLDSTLSRAPDIFRTSFDDKTYDNDADFWPKSVLQAVFLSLRKDGKRWPGYDAITDKVVKVPILAWPLQI